MRRNRSFNRSANFGARDANLSRMTWPLEYQKASIDFEQFMLAARDEAGLATTNMAWNMVEGVLHVFRRRLNVAEAVAFANLLPPLIRALFLEGWRPELAPVPFTDRASLTEEVKQLRSAHNFSPPNAIEAVARALRKSVDQAALEHFLESTSEGAVQFWAVPGPGEEPAAPAPLRQAPGA